MVFSGKNVYVVVMIYFSVGHIGVKFKSVVTKTSIGSAETFITQVFANPPRPRRGGGATPPPTDGFSATAQNA